MKNYLKVCSVSILLVLCLSCSENNPVEPKNEPPEVPAISQAVNSPAHGAIGQSITPVLQWTCSDPDGDPLSFDVHLGKTSSPPVVSANQTELSHTCDTLDYNCKYYWRIVARDNNNNATNSPVWEFTTLSLEGHLDVNLDTLDFGSNKDTLTFIISNTGGGNLTWVNSPSHNWLNVNPNNGITSTEEDTVSITIDRNQLAAGTYIGYVAVGSSNGSDTVYVMVFEPEEIPSLVLNTHSLNFGTGSVELSFNITNSGTGTLTWTITESSTWLSVAPNAGSNQSETDTIKVTVDRTGLNSGFYSTQVNIQSNGGYDTVGISMEVPGSGYICPLAVGNYWNFDDSSRLEITGQTMITYAEQTYQVYFWEWVTDNPYYRYRYLVRNESDGLWSIGEIYYDSTTVDTILYRTMLLKYPVTVGEKWIVNEGGYSYEMECVSLNENLSTPAGTFPCVVYKEGDIITYGGEKNTYRSPLFSNRSTLSYNKNIEEAELFIYFSPGVGYVGALEKDNEIVNEIFLLTSYHLY
ncbi:MAG: BACON domain-containing protein [Candidatus Zixiibacteriota bacterium]